MSIPTDRLPAWTLAAPCVTLGASLGLTGNTSIVAGLLLAGVVHLILLATWLFLILAP